MTAILKLLKREDISNTFEENTTHNKRGCCTTQYLQNFDEKDKSIKMQNIDQQIQKSANSSL
jgi:hypothetical protein